MLPTLSLLRANAPLRWLLQKYSAEAGTPPAVRSNASFPPASFQPVWAEQTQRAVSTTTATLSTPAASPAHAEESIPMEADAVMRSPSAPPGQSEKVPWLDRVNELPEIPPSDLTKLHGVLLAAGWLEMRVAADVLAAPGRLSGCYRLTADGRRAARWLDQTADLPDEEW